jgi:hypothetical protein
MTATPLPGEIGIPPFAIYRSKVAAWENGTIKLLYVRLKGQGAKVLIEELPGDDAVTLGNKYQLKLERISEGEPVPPIDMPTFPKLPEPPIELLPEPIEPPKYYPSYPGYPVQPPIYGPYYPGMVPPIEGPYAPKSPPIYHPEDEAKPDPDEEE